MAAVKRKHFDDSDEDVEYSEAGSSQFSDDEVDISSALVGRRPAKARRQEKAVPIECGGDDDDDLQELIRESITKRDVKGGTDMLKKTKGKAKMTKGEVGGGSFQSMGESGCQLSIERANEQHAGGRLAPVAAAIVNTTGLSDTHTDSAPVHPRAAH